MNHKGHKVVSIGCSRKKKAHSRRNFKISQKKQDVVKSPLRRRAPAPEALAQALGDLGAE